HDRLVRLPGRPRAAGLARHPAGPLLDPLPRRLRGRHPRHRHGAHGVLLRGVRVPQPGAVPRLTPGGGRRERGDGRRPPLPAPFSPLPSPPAMDLELVTVGTELLLGFTVDTNGAELGRAFAAAGV